MIKYQKVVNIYVTRVKINKKKIDKIIKFKEIKRNHISGLSIMMHNESTKNANVPGSSFKHLIIW